MLRRRQHLDISEQLHIITPKLHPFSTPRLPPSGHDIFMTQIHMTDWSTMPHQRYHNSTTSLGWPARDQSSTPETEITTLFSLFSFDHFQATTLDHTASNIRPWRIVIISHPFISTFRCMTRNPIKKQRIFFFCTLHYWLQGPFTMIYFVSCKLTSHSKTRVRFFSSVTQLLINRSPVSPFWAITPTDYAGSTAENAPSRTLTRVPHSWTCDRRSQSTCPSLCFRRQRVCDCWATLVAHMPGTSAKKKKRKSELKRAR